MDVDKDQIRNQLVIINVLFTWAAHQCHGKLFNNLEIFMEIVKLEVIQHVYSCEISNDNLMRAGQSVNIAVQIMPLNLVTVI